jgi:serine/threonine protein kinase/AmiR/NasT family two-component response regulator
VTRILIIDDEADIRNDVAQILGYEGYEVLQAEDGQAGVELALQYLPDLVICDITMPRLDGYGTLGQLQSDPSTAMIPFMFLSARADRASVRYGIELGADDYLTKPFTVPELVGAVRVRLAKHELAVSTFMKLTQDVSENMTIITTSAAKEEKAPSLTGVAIRAYQFWEKIAEGGAGTVYRAYQPSVGREVAVKVLRQKYAENVEFLHRFQKEAELIARLEHPHIVPLYDYWQDESGVYIVMRWLRGGSLRGLLRKHGRMDIRDVATLLDQVSDALSVAHRIGIIHRDIKPDNILLDEQGNAYLSDFGIAKSLSSPDEERSEQAAGALEMAQHDFTADLPLITPIFTNSDLIPGTPAYLSPEQIQQNTLSLQTDIYSLGITLYEMLTGTQPFTGPFAEIAIRHLQEPIPSIHDQFPDVPPALDDVIQKATAKDPQDRYSSTFSLAADFRRATGRPRRPKTNPLI